MIHGIGTRKVRSTLIHEHVYLAVTPHAPRRVARRGRRALNGERDEREGRRRAGVGAAAEPRRTEQWPDAAPLVADDDEGARCVV